MNRNGATRTYTKSDIVKRVAAMNGAGRIESARWVENVLKAVREIMMGPDTELRIELRDFGIFEVKRTKSKPKARNPQTGQIIHVPAHRKTHFKPGRILKDFLSTPVDEAEQGPRRRSEADR
jgi:integration host factor subunit beta